MSSRIKNVLKFTPRVLLLLVACYFVLLNGWRDALFGRLQRKASEVFHRDTGDVTEARIYLLMGEESRKTSDTFPIGDQPVYGTVVLHGAELEQFMEAWGRQDVGFEGQGMCHDPAYGFRFYSGNRMVAETSVCWHCKNFTVDLWPFGSARYGFDAHSEQAKELLNFCDSRLPYKRPPGSKSSPPARISLTRATQLATSYILDESYRGQRLKDLFEIVSITRVAKSDDGSAWHVGIWDLNETQSIRVYEGPSPDEQKRKTLVVYGDGSVKIKEFHEVGRLPVDSNRGENEIRGD